ncbi:hypothetical protein O6H91_04G066500 [Diphasiastrum complanatum]|uniref:Uncharacterized protein n=1 Tax=Diphasiastrum complanatum TaxID=34168 RepID=A0ACC2DXK9_DIPCM|nr:hypothetical protein O6H91_04G066500 [Diphasiastrum complanatum]
MAMVKVVEVGGRGRAMVAAVPIAAGQVLLAESPLLLYIDASAAASPSPAFCDHCSRTLPSLSPSIIPCPSCSQAAFCSSACASAASHPPHVCQALRKLQSSAIDLHSQTQLRFLIAAYNLVLAAPSLFQQLLQMEGSSVIDSHAVFLHPFIQELVKSWPLQNVSVQLTGALLQKDNRNAFAIMAPSSEPGVRRVRAYALYSQASFFNHDCLPNACRFDYVDDPDKPNSSIFIRALHDISPGNEVCLSYFPINWNLAERRNRLLQDYGFECTCERCVVEDQWDDEGEGHCNTEEEDLHLGHSEHKGDEEMDDDDSENAADDFPHAMFFVKHLCPVEDCGGTMAPIPPEQLVEELGSGCSRSMECNMCGYLRTNEEFLQDLEEHKGMET